MKFVYFLGLLLALFSTCASATGNPGRSAMECVSASQEKDDVKFTNKCTYDIFIVYCGEMKYTKQRCGDGPKGNSFYTHSTNIGPGKTTTSYAIRDYRYAACEGGIAFGKDEIQDSPDGSFICIGPKSAADNKASAVPPSSAPPQNPISRPSPQNQAMPTSPIGTWQTDTGESSKGKLTLRENGTAIYEGEFPGRWTRQGDRITVDLFGSEAIMRLNKIALTMELNITNTGMTGTQETFVTPARRLRVTLTRMN